MVSQSRYKWFVVVMLWFVCMFNYADRQAIFSVFPLLEDEMGLSKFEEGLIGSSFMWVYALALPFAGLIADRFQRKRLILAGLIFWSLITVATALSLRFWHLFVFRALEGFGEAFYMPASLALISDFHHPRTRSRAMGLHQSGVYVGTVAGGTFAGLLAERYGWRSGFYVFGILGTLLGLVLLGLLREPQRGQAEDLVALDTNEENSLSVPVAAKGVAISVLGMLKHSTILVLIAVFVGANFVAAIVLTWMPKLLHDKFEMELGEAAFIATAYLQGGSVLGTVAGGVWADRLARRHAAGRMITQAIGLFLGVPFIILTGGTSSQPLLILGLFSFGFAKGLYDSNIWASLYDVVPLERRATAVGIMNSIGWFGAAAGPVVFALAAEHYGMSAALSANSLVYFAVGLLLCFGIRTMTRRFPPKTPPAVAFGDNSV